MKRGTLGLFGDENLQLLPSFRYACRMRLSALNLICRSLLEADFTAAEAWIDREVELYHGDLIEGGRGEVWALAQE